MYSGKRIGESTEVKARLRGAKTDRVVATVVIEDLRGVLTHLSGRSGPNGPLGPMTQYLVAAGAQRLSDVLRGGLERPGVDERPPRMLSALVGHEPFVEELGLSVHHMRRRWPSAGDWYADLLAYILRPGRHATNLGETSAWLDEVFTLPLGQFAEQLVRQQVRMTQDPTLYRLADAIQWLWPEHAAVQEALRHEQELLRTAWSDLYLRVLSTYGLRLRPGLTLEEGAWTFSSLITTEAHERTIDQDLQLLRDPVVRSGLHRATRSSLVYLAGASVGDDDRPVTLEEIRIRPPRNSTSPAGTGGRPVRPGRPRSGWPVTAGAGGDRGAGSGT